MENWIGNVIGSSIGLIAILIGALWNAHLNRRRDDRLRESDRKSLAAALSSEIGQMMRHVRDVDAFAMVLFDKYQRSGIKYPAASERMTLPPLNVATKVSDRIGLLGPEVAAHLSRTWMGYAYIQGFMTAAATEFFAGMLDLDALQNRHSMISDYLSGCDQLIKLLDEVVAED